jgi:hypothetical protein
MGDAGKISHSISQFTFYRDFFENWCIFYGRNNKLNKILVFLYLPLVADFGSLENGDSGEFSNEPIFRKFHGPQLSPMDIF